MGFNSYPSYHSYSLEIPLEVPKEWTIKKLRFIGKFYSSGIDKKIVENEPLVNMINYTDIYGNQSLLLDANREYMVVSCPEWKKLECQVQVGDLIFTPSSETADEIGLSALVNEYLPETVFSYHVLRFLFNDNLDHRFRKYLCNNTYVLAQFTSRAQGTTRQTLDRNDFNSTIVVLPSIIEQQTIASFLDYKTKQIDDLIAKKEELLKLLEEKRIALITQAVTKGLDPNVKMKPSGIDWLGDIPEHWELKPLKRIFLVLNGSTPKSSTPEYWDGEINWFTPDDLGNNNEMVINESRRKITVEGYESCGVKIAPAFSLALSTRAPIGHLSIIGNPGCVNQGCRLLVPQFGNPIYWYYLMIATKQEIISFGQGSTFYELSRTKLNKILLPAPNTDEQNVILNNLESKLNIIKSLEEKVFIAIEKLKEYRTSLITAAVTGKIDVRDFKPPREE